jgi:hypothetical protein
LIPYILEPDKSSKERRKNWSRLIQKIYEVDPLICPKCSSEMKVISVIEDEEVIKKILKHLGLWDLKARSPTKATGPPKIIEYSTDYFTSQLPASDMWLYRFSIVVIILESCSIKYFCSLNKIRCLKSLYYDK